MKKLTGACVLIVTLLVQVALAAISVDTSGIATSGSADATQTVSLTVASNSNKLMLGGYGALTNAADSAFTFNGDALTQNTGSEISEATSVASGIWYRKEPDVATGNLVSTPGNVVQSGVCGLALYGVEQTSTIRDSDETSTGGGAGTSLSLTLTTVSGDYVFYTMFAYAPSSDPGALDHTAGSATGETEIGEVDPLATQTAMSCAYAVASGSTTQVGYSWPTSARATLVAVSVAPAASASTPGSMLRRRRAQ